MSGNFSHTLLDQAAPPLPRARPGGFSSGGPNFNSPILWRWTLWAVGLPLLLVLFSSLLEVRTLEAQTPGDSGPSLPIPDRPYDEAEAQAIDRQIMCPVCPAESIDQAQVPIARQMRQIVRDQLTQGASQAEILEFFAQRYGAGILASPPKSGFNLLAWIFPVVGMAGALLAGWLVIRSMTSRRLVSPGAAVSQQPSLEPFLNQVDAEIGLEPSAPASNEGQPGVEFQGKDQLDVANRPEGGSPNDG